MQDLSEKDFPTLDTPQTATPKDPKTEKPGVLESLSFKKTGGTELPAVVFTVKGLSTYTLNKIRDGLYELKMPNVKPASESLLLPGMPPENFESIEMVVSKFEDGNLIVKIFVGDEVTLVPFSNGKEIWVKASGK